jgi:F-type H+-transporting ATPase subunit epsilon
MPEPDQRKVLHLQVVGPSGVAFDGPVESVVVPAWEGRLGIMRNHAPLLGMLRPGRIAIRTEAGEQSLDVPGGFITVRRNRIRVVTATTEPA